MQYVCHSTKQTNSSAPMKVWPFAITSQYDPQLIQVARNPTGKGNWVTSYIISNKKNSKTSSQTIKP